MLSSRRYKLRTSIGRLNGWFDATVPSSNVLSVYPNVPNDIDKWGCDTWILYYKLMKEKLGKEEAQSILLIDADRASFFATLYTTCKGDCNFIKYFKSEGIPTGNFISDLYCGAGNIITATTDATVDVISGVGSVASGAGNTAKAIGKILPVLLIGGSIAYGYYLYNKSNKK